MGSGGGPGAGPPPPGARRGWRAARRAWALAVVCFLAVSCALRPKEPVVLPEPGVCFECFWEHQDPAFREELVAVYRDRRVEDPFVRADVRYLLGRVTGDRGEVCGSFEDLRKLRRTASTPRRRLAIVEMLAFTAAECGEDPGRWFHRAARAAGPAGNPAKQEIYERMADDAFLPEFGEATIRRELEVAPGSDRYVLGRSAIRVRRGQVVAAQVDRTVRDWISYQMGFGFEGGVTAPDRLIDWHEGARLREVLEAAPATVEPVEGTLAVRRGNAWFAPDEDGVFRFEVLPDKVRYPTTRVHGAIALLVDTHGISALVAGAAEREADVVVGCGDAVAKMKAAAHLASKGVDVYFPCDRFVGEVIGQDGPGTLIGSAPVDADGEEAVIGDRPVSFRLNETIVAQDTSLAGRYQYYDAPARYFRRLAELAPIPVVIIEVDGPGQSDRVVEHARELGAEAIAVRVETAEDAAPVRRWLGEAPSHRAVLFHSAPYPAGIALFDEFPGQTTFGDPRPVFLGGHSN